MSGTDAPQPTLDGRVALVTGGAKRVGRAIVKALGSAGCDVAIHCHRSVAEAELLAEELRRAGRRAVSVVGDLNDPSCWRRIVDEVVEALGGLDILVNNASAFREARGDTLADFDVEPWERMMRTNLLAPVGLCRYAAEHLRARGRGRVVNLGDIAADRPSPLAMAYGVSKAALTAATKAMARALAPEVLVNGVAPGIAVFPEDYSEDQRSALLGLVPQGRAGTPEEVAGLVRFLVESGAYMTGQIIAIDGGRNLV